MIQEQRADIGLTLRYLPILLAVFGLAGAAMVGGIATQEPVLAIVAVVALASLLFSFMHRDIATTGFIVILFTNAAVIAVNFHGLPLAVGSAFPLLLLIPFTYHVIFKRERIIFTSLMMLLLGLLLVQLLGTLNAFSISEAANELFVFVVEGVAIYFLLLNTIRTRETLRNVIRAVLISAIFLGIFPIFQQVTGAFDNNFGGFAQVTGRGFNVTETLVGTTNQPRLSGAIGEKNRFAQIMLMLAVIAMTQIWRGPSRTWRLVAFAAAGIAAIASILPFSRGAAVGAALLVGVGLMLRFITVRQLLLLLAATVILLMIFPQYTVRLVTLEAITGPFTDSSDVTTETDGAIQGRYTEMVAALIVYVEHPVVGVGPGMFRFYSGEVGNELGVKRLIGTRRAHSLYLEVLANTGTLGFVLTMGIVAITIWQLRAIRLRLLKKDPEMANIVTGLALGILAYMTTGVFLHFAYIRYFWAVMGIAAAAIQIGKLREREVAQPDPVPLRDSPL